MPSDKQESLQTRIDESHVGWGSIFGLFLLFRWAFLFVFFFFMP